MRYENTGMTRRERDVYNYILKYKSINGFAPTLNEIADNLITSRSFVRQCVYRLQDKGFLKYDNTKRRSIIVTKFVS